MDTNDECDDDDADDVAGIERITSALLGLG